MRSAEASTVLRSHGQIVRRSITSTPMPSAASRSAAASDSCTVRLQLTIVTSSPRRTTRALPMATSSDRSTGDSSAHNSLCSRYATGSPLRTAAFSNEWLSCGFDGQTTTSPGTCANQASSDCECCAADALQMPVGIRITIGTRPCPPNMNRFFAAWFTISSIAHSAKSTTRISTTGLSPVSAMPTAEPAIVASEIGVSMTRCAPNRSSRPRYWPKMPPRPRSSPSATTDSSSCISSASASAAAVA